MDSIFDLQIVLLGLVQIASYLLLFRIFRIELPFKWHFLVVAIITAIGIVTLKHVILFTVTSSSALSDDFNADIIATWFMAFVSTLLFLGYFSLLKQKYLVKVSWEKLVLTAIGFPAITCGLFFIERLVLFLLMLGLGV